MILRIKNRTENWKTAYEFAPFFRDADARLRLVQHLAKSDVADSCEITLELYWKGMRDYLHSVKPQRGRALNDEIIRDLAVKYQRIFPYLRDKVEKYRTENEGKKENFKALNDKNYRVECGESECVLGRNLYHTEIDIVLETPDRLYIGEAKFKSDFGSDSEHVLTHQLIRQYVMARILLSCLGEEKEVVPFVVGEEKSKMKNRAQVDFMVQQGWLCSCNVLEWSDIRGIIGVS